MNTQLYRSPNGDTWFLAHDPVTANAPASDGDSSAS
jgi:hypothetical protein